MKTEGSSKPLLSSVARRRNSRGEGELRGLLGHLSLSRPKAQRKPCLTRSDGREKAELQVNSKVYSVTGDASDRRSRENLAFLGRTAEK